MPFGSLESRKPSRLHRSDNTSSDHACPTEHVIDDLLSWQLLGHFYRNSYIGKVAAVSYNRDLTPVVAWPAATSQVARGAGA